jgi:hypothetical protein
LLDDGLLANVHARIERLGTATIAPVIRDRVVTVDASARTVLLRVADRATTA